eukprot:TRINITY_DN4053_c0_g2_i1.p1 TRINITY_DN4053_c0_g2~~TRINITY_DN4053_c0_g2_i1.p1  ORF type:complete len:1046 (-),score=328.50 TRINITY_DN4053_c0_g2_i1:39-3137(-)
MGIIKTTMQPPKEEEKKKDVAAVKEVVMKVSPKAPTIEHDKVLQGMLERAVHPLPSTTVSLKVNGIFSLPESWKAKAGQEDLNRYELQCFDVKIEGGKIQAKQLTEEEKKALEEAQSKGKKAVPKPDKKKQEEEPSPEEKAKEEAEKKAKEEAEAKLKAEWDKLDEETKFYRTQENAYKEPRLSFITINEKNEPNIIAKTAELKEQPLIAFEEYVNTENGCWLYFDRLLPIEEEDTKKGKGKPPAKKGQVEPEKPLRGKAWVPFYELMKPGGTETDLRVFLETVGDQASPKIEEKKEGKDQKEAKEVKDNKDRKDDKDTKDAKDSKDAKVEVKKEEPEKVFEPAKTYVHLHITLSNPINPPLPPEGLPKPHDLCKDKPQMAKCPTTKDVMDMYKLQLKLTIGALGQEYNRIQEKEKEAEKQSSQQQQKAKEQLLGDKLEKMRLKRKEGFLKELNQSGLYFMLKEKLKKAVARIAKEKYRKIALSKELSKEEKDKFYSELYVFLIEQMRLTTDEIAQKKIIDLHEDVIDSKAITQKKKQDKMDLVFKETPYMRNLRLYKDYERALDFVTAEQHLLDIIKDNDKDEKAWTIYYRFAMKTGNIAKAEECLRKVLTIAPNNLDIQLALGGLLVHRKRYKEATTFIKDVLKSNFTRITANILNAIMFELEQHKGLYEKHIAIAKRKKMRDLNLLPPKGSVKFDAPLPDPQRPLTNEEIDSLFYELVEFLIVQKQSLMAEKVMTKIMDKESAKYLILNAKCLYIRGAYAECSGVLSKLIEKEPQNQQALKYMGNALFLQGNLFDSEEAYVKAIRIKPPPKSLTLFERLGQVYLKRKSWKDAKVVFKKCCASPNMNSSTSWKKLGVSYMKLAGVKPDKRMPNFLKAEDCLTQANILDNNNADVWGYLTIMCLLMGQRQLQAEQTLSETMRLGLRNVEILDEIADHYQKLGDFRKSAECLQRAVDIEPKNGMLWATLADSYIHCEGQKKASIDCYEKALEHTEGKANKADIALMLHDYITADPTLSTCLLYTSPSPRDRG